jgi:circadian clock protein KaiC
MVRVNTGVPGLDKLMGGGIPAGKVVLVAGPAGTGKTTLAAQFVAAGCKKGEPGILVTLDQDRNKLKGDLEMLGIDCSKITFLGGNAVELDRWRRKVKAGWPDLIAELAEVIKAKRAKRVAVDSINGLLLLFDNDADRRMALSGMVNALSELGVTAILTGETHGNGEISWWGFEEFVVDGVISIMELRFENYYRHALAVRKMRGTAHDRGIVSAALTDRGLVVYPDEKVIPG